MNDSHMDINAAKKVNTAHATAEAVSASSGTDTREVWAPLQPGAKPSTSTIDRVDCSLFEMTKQMRDLNLAISSMAQGQKVLIQHIASSAVHVSSAGPVAPSAAVSGSVPSVVPAPTLTSHQSLPVSNQGIPSTIQLPSDTTDGSITDNTKVLAGSASVGRSTAQKALQGEYVDLQDFLPIQYTSTAQHSYESVIEGGNFVFRPRRKQRIDRFESWLSAWNNYESLLISSMPQHYKAMSAYRVHIQESSQLFLWEKVYEYDCRFRSELGAKLSLSFGDVDSTLYITKLNANAVKPKSSSSAKSCFRCHSMDHLIGDCPFPARTPLAQNSPAKKAGSYVSQPKWFASGGQEGCNNFNNGRCTFPACVRAHVCRGCRGPAPFISCTACNSNHMQPGQPPAHSGGFSQGFGGPRRA